MLAHVTTVMEITAVLLLVLAAAWASASLTASFPAGCAVAGLGLVAGSWVLSKAGTVPG
jgi:hypothetical protein